MDKIDLTVVIKKEVSDTQQMRKIVSWKYAVFLVENKGFIKGWSKNPEAESRAVVNNEQGIMSIE